MEMGRGERGKVRGRDFVTKSDIMLCYSSYVELLVIIALTFQLPFRVYRRMPY